MSTQALRMPAHLQQTAMLATQVVDTSAPTWASSSSTLTLDKGLDPTAIKPRAERDIFRLPDSNPAVREWLYSRPGDEAVGEDAFQNAATESSTIFRIHPIDQFDSAIKISPTVSNHWLMVPVQSINGVTVGLAYLDVLYQRPADDDLRVPPLPVGKFAIEDATGEVFVTGWGEDIMIVGWIQSIIRCERVRELLMFQAPPRNRMPPQNLLRRNSFYERRKCHLCGHGPDLASLSEPCSGIGPMGHDSAAGPKPLTKIATLYRRFRGAYFGVCLKTSYINRMRTDQIVVPVFIDVKQGLNSVKQRFKNNLQRNIHFSLNSNAVEGLFGLSPRSSSRLFILKSSQPVSSLPAIMDSPTRGKRKHDSWEYGDNVRMEEYSPMSCIDQDSSQASSERSHSPPTRTRRRVGVDDVDRGTREFERIRRNRIAADRSNKARKERIRREKEELEKLKNYTARLEARKNELLSENNQLHHQIALRDLSIE